MTELEKIIHSVRLETVQSRHLLKLINDLSADATDVIEIIECWLAEVPGLAEKTLSALDAGDQQTLKHSTHTIKSAARSVGAMALGDLADAPPHQCDRQGPERPAQRPHDRPPRKEIIGQPFSMAWVRSLSSGSTTVG